MGDNNSRGARRGAAAAAIAAATSARVAKTERAAAVLKAVRCFFLCVCADCEGRRRRGTALALGVPRRRHPAAALEPARSTGKGLRPACPACEVGGCWRDAEPGSAPHPGWLATQGEWAGREAASGGRRATRTGLPRRRAPESLAAPQARTLDLPRLSSPKCPAGARSRISQRLCAMRGACGVLTFCGVPLCRPPVKLVFSETRHRVCSGQRLGLAGPGQHPGRAHVLPDAGRGGGPHCLHPQDFARGVPIWCVVRRAPSFFLAALIRVVTFGLFFSCHVSGGPANALSLLPSPLHPPARPPHTPHHTRRHRQGGAAAPGGQPEL